MGVKCIPASSFPTPEETLAEARGQMLCPETTWLVRDNYGLREDFNEHVSDEYKHFVEFDDTSRMGRTYEILVNPAVSKEVFKSKGDRQLNSGTEILGASASIIRLELRELRSTVSNLKFDRTRKGLVSFGYSDPTDESSLIWGSLPSSAGASWEFLLGPDYLGGLRLGMAVDQKRTFSLEGLLGVEYFSYQLGIGAGGVSSYERAFCGIPSINFAPVENQIGAASILEKSNAALFLRDTDSDSINSAVDKLHDSSVWTSLREAGMELVDGLGAERLLVEIMERMR
jgi:spore coat polysaccharide biosynthesis predicted glycosyltransferase SpsG